MTTSRTILRRGGGLTAAAAVIAFDAHLIGPYITRAAAAMSHPALSWVAIALAAEIVSVLALASLQRRMLLASGTRAPLPSVVGLTYAAYAISMSLPAGTAVSTGYTFRRLQRLGATATSAAFTVISSGVLSTIAYGLVAVAGFTISGGSSGGPIALVVSLLAGGFLVVITRSLLHRPDLIERVGSRSLSAINRVMHREPGAGMGELRRSTRALNSIRPRGRDWTAGMTAAVLNWIADLGCLLASCQAVGAHGATLGVVLLAYLGGTSVSVISLIPGGLGVVDAALIVILVHNGVGPAPATAAVLLYRALSFGFGLLAGWTAWIGHAHAVRRAEAADAAALQVAVGARHSTPRLVAPSLTPFTGSRRAARLHPIRAARRRSAPARAPRDVCGSTPARSAHRGRSFPS